jgi:hypothetical protein
MRLSDKGKVMKTNSENRIQCALFCYLKDSTAISNLEAEASHPLIQGWLDIYYTVDGQPFFVEIKEGIHKVTEGVRQLKFYKQNAKNPDNVHCVLAIGEASASQSLELAQAAMLCRSEGITLMLVDATTGEPRHAGDFL